MMEGIAIYGSTGSIGKQTLEVVSKLGYFKVVALVCNENIELLEKQIRKYNPKYAGVANQEAAEKLKERVKDTKTIVVSGPKESIQICAGSEVNTVVNSTVGISGLEPTLEFIKHRKTIAIANKESFVVGGELVTRIAKENGVKIAPIWKSNQREGPAIIPIDSEPVAILQCLRGEETSKIKNILLTASGGPFRTSNMEMLRTASIGDALNHPTWKMGGRITIDSATLMNKGFEVIEISWLFGVKPENIDVQIHPQSILHSGVQFTDGNYKTQLGPHDMRLPIQYALTYPNRLSNEWETLDLPIHAPRLDFSRDGLYTEKYKCLDLAREAIRLGGTAPAVLNGADERAVELFLKSKITYLEIADSVEYALRNHKVVKNPTLNELLTADKSARASVDSYIAERHKVKHISRSIG